MPATPGRIPGLLVLEYVEVSEFFLQTSMRPGVHMLEKLTLGHKRSRYTPETTASGPDGPGFPKCSTFWSSTIEGGPWRADTPFRFDQTLVEQT